MPGVHHILMTLYVQICPLFADECCCGLRNRLIVVACSADRDRTDDLTIHSNRDASRDTHKRVRTRSQGDRQGMVITSIITGGTFFARGEARQSSATRFRYSNWNRVEPSMIRSGKREKGSCSIDHGDPHRATRTLGCSQCRL